jgi:rubrerythrin
LIKEKYFYFINSNKSYSLKGDLYLKWKCDKCGYEFDSDDFPEEGFKCPGCGDEDCSFSILE